MTEIPGEARTAAPAPQATAQPHDWLTPAQVAERFELSEARIRQMLRDGVLLGTLRDDALRIPVELAADRTVLKHLPGVLTLLRDVGYNDEEMLRWLYTPDESLPGTPAESLSTRPTEVKRRAQALGF